jgi:hypothetical protein
MRNDPSRTGTGGLACLNISETGIGAGSYSLPQKGVTTTRPAETALLTIVVAVQPPIGPDH